MNGNPTRRDWMQVGRPYWEQREAKLQAVIDGLEWLDIPKDGPGPNLPMAPGLGIQEVIKQLRLPKVDAIAWNGYMETGDLGDKCYGAVYGIQAHYRNCDIRVYVYDHGDGIAPLCADVWEKAQVAP